MLPGQGLRAGADRFPRACRRTIGVLAFMQDASSLRLSAQEFDEVDPQSFHAYLGKLFLPIVDVFLVITFFPFFR